MKLAVVQEYLSGIKPEEEFAIIILRESEIRQIAGANYPDMEQLSHLLSRLPRAQYNGPDITSCYWWDKRETFKTLVEDGIERIRKDQESNRVMEANAALEKELGLKNVIISLPFEVRPMKRFMDNAVTVMVPQTARSGELSENSTFADFLRLVDELNDGCGDHRFLEDWSFKDNNALAVYFGS